MTKIFLTYFSKTSKYRNYLIFIGNKNEYSYEQTRQDHKRRDR